MYEVAGLIRRRTEKIACKASVKIFTAIIFSLLLSSFATNVTSLLNIYVPTSGLSWNATLKGYLEAAESTPVPNLYPSSRAPLPAFPGQPDAGGEIKGKVTYEGTLPKYKPLNMVNEPTCAKQYTTPVLPENVVAGPNNGLKNVVVYISAGIEEHSAPTQPMILKQWGCRYVPHVLTVETNQEIWVKNEDSVAHTVHPMARINMDVNRSQPPGTPPLVIKYDQPEVIRVKCELHPWMRGVFVVLKNSHYAISDENGSFSLPDLPPGKYTVKAWHEQFGEQTQVVTIGSAEAKTLNFAFKARP